MERLAFLSRINSWWQTKQVRQSFLFKAHRQELASIITALGHQRILSIIGPRRVGKSTLVMQTIDYLIKQGTDPQMIVFFSCDEPILFADGATISDLLTVYENQILHQRFEDLAEKQKVYVFIDEIHNAKDWQLHLKSYYDRKLPVKFVVSGSSSALLFKGSRESLLGRIEELTVLPLSFQQFQNFYQIYRQDLGLKDFQKLLPDITFFEDPIAYYQAVSEKSWQLAASKPQVLKVLNEYLLFGGYPESFSWNDIFIWQNQLLNDIIDKGLYRDIVRVYNIANPEKLEHLLHYFAANNGQTHATTTIGELLGLSKDTVAQYLHYLAEAFQICIQDNYSTNVGKTIRKNKKIYVTDNGIINAILHQTELNAMVEGQLIEGNCVREACCYANGRYYETGYWRDRDKEVDMILIKNKQVIPIEIKYRNSINSGDLSGLTAFKHRYQPEISCVITKEYLAFQDQVVFMPYWLIR